MPPTIHILCEAESATIMPNGDKLFDPLITDTGVLQSVRIRDNFPHMNQVRAIFSSPLRRAIETGLIAFDSVMRRGLQITLRQNLRGLHGIPAYTGSSWEELREEFGLKLDLVDLQAGWWYVTNDINDFSPALCIEQARQARVNIRDAARRLGDNDHIVVISHRSFIRYLIESIVEHFEDGEYRSYRFTDLFNEYDDMASLARVGAENESSSSSSTRSGTTLVGGHLNPIEISGDSSSGSSYSNPDISSTVASYGSSSPMPNLAIRGSSGGAENYRPGRVVYNVGKRKLSAVPRVAKRMRNEY
ncbi:hypothetical protein F4801DRAFT_583803 [Xylaria longipes]|nr:hypothetical protein F4801DRAFT_583803 [Xylaria longipes]RYC54178.1 hypothetical protein CHU98_g12032 [Xylaria longipes]